MDVIRRGANQGDLMETEMSGRFFSGELAYPISSRHYNTTKGAGEMVGNHWPMSKEPLNRVRTRCRNSWRKLYPAPVHK